MAVTAVAIGVGANTAVFSVIHGVLFPRLDYPTAHRLVQVEVWTHPSNEGYPTGVVADRYFGYRDQTAAFDQLVAVKWEGFVLEGTVRFTDVLAVGNGFFSTFGVEPILGRTLSASPDVPSGPAGVNAEMMLGYDLWQSHFGGDSTVIGRTVVLDHWGAEDDAHNARTVVGILPPGFRPPRFRINGRMRTGSAGALVPLSEGRWFRAQRDFAPFAVLGRLRAGITSEQAASQLQAVSDRIGSTYPDEAGYRIEVTPLSALPGTLYGRALALLWAVVAAVLLIACLNVACLMLARSTAREGEFAVRASLGCSLGRITQQLVTESVLVAASGAVIGTLLAQWGTRGLIALYPGSVIGLERAAINGPVLAVTLLTSVGAAALFTWAPALVAARLDLGERLRGISGRVSMRSGRLLQGLLAGEVALASILLVGAGLFLNSFVRLTRVEPGFDIENVLAVTAERAPLLTSGYGDGADQIPLTVLYDRMREAARSLSGVSAVAVQAGPTGTPFSRRDVSDVTVEDRHRPGAEDGLQATWTNVDPFYFDVMRIPILAGRNFTAADEADGELVAIVSESAARRFWPDGNVLGRVLTYGHQDLDRGIRDTRVPAPRLYTVVGIVGDVVTADVERGPDPAVYTPLTQSYYAELATTVVMRPSAELRTLEQRARNVVLAVDPNELIVTRVTSMEDALGAAMAEPRFFALALTLLAATALALALMGIYGVVAYISRRRTYELGIRAALGARPVQTAGTVLLQGAIPAAVGLTIGVAGSVYVGRFLPDYLFGIEPGDPLTIGVACISVMGMVLAACITPARRAVTMNPIDLLRSEQAGANRS